VRALRRGALALVLAGIAAVAVRVRPSAGVPPQRGGWRELSGSELR
jgi:hypothetical protein